MSNPNTFITNYVAACGTLVSVLQALRVYNDMIAQDSTLVTRYFDNTNNPTHRTDIVAADMTAAQGAVTQLLFAFDSGAPTQKAGLYKMQP